MIEPENLGNRLREINTDKVYYVNESKGNKKIKMSPKKLNYLINNQNDDESSYMHKLNNSANAGRLSSKFEKEMQWKVKTILKKDILGRYRKSPYLKSIDK